MTPGWTTSPVVVGGREEIDIGWVGWFGGGGRGAVALEERPEESTGEGDKMEEGREVVSLSVSRLS